MTSGNDHTDFDPWPELNRSQMMEFLLTKYPNKPGLARLIQSAITQKLTNNKIAWNDLGIYDLAQQERLEGDVINLINQFVHDKSLRDFQI
jgi:hypothetical protein